MYSNWTSPNFILKPKEFRYHRNGGQNKNKNKMMKDMMMKRGAKASTSEGKQEDSMKSKFNSTALTGEQYNYTPAKSFFLSMTPKEDKNIESKKVEGKDENSTFTLRDDFENSMGRSKSNDGDDEKDAVLRLDGANETLLDGRLVVNVDQRYLFWEDDHGKLCNLLKHMSHVTTLDEVPKDVDELVRRPLLNATMDCVEISKIEDFGQGNWITALYSVRLAAAAARVDFRFHCKDGRASQLKLLLPWFDGYYPAPDVNHPWPHVGDRPTEEQVCAGYRENRVDLIADEIRDDIRRMAVTLVGARDKGRNHVAVPAASDAFYPNIVLDDVAIHFRCGDVMGGAQRGDFGMIQFREYDKWINKDTKSIGIVTQSFERWLNRKKDAEKVNQCRRAVNGLVKHLESSFPNAAVTIRNGRDESMPLAYARLTMADQSFTTLSSFGIFPVIGTFGQGYFQKGNEGVNPFSEYLPAAFPNLHMMEAPVLSTGKMRKMETDKIIEWLMS